MILCKILGHKWESIEDTPKSVINADTGVTLQLKGRRCLRCPKQQSSTDLLNIFLKKLWEVHH